MSSQSGEFSCVEMSWEESSTKCKNYYGVVEEPREERIIPIKIDRGISIHTASDEEEEPFWVVESVKKHEEVRNEIKRIKDNKNSQESLADNYFEDEDNSLNDLLKRVKKQRNDLENILEKENNNSNIFEMNREEILSQNNSRLNESFTHKTRSVSRLSPLEENIKSNKISENELNESISSISNTHIKHKKGYSSFTENISNELTNISNTTEHSNTPKKGVITNQLSTDMVENYSSFEIKNLDTKYSKHEVDILNTIKAASISRLSSKEEYDNTSLPQKTIDEYSEKPKRGSLSRLSSIEERNNSSIPTKIIFNEYCDKSKRGSLSSIEDSRQDFTLNKTTPYGTKLGESNIEFIENDSMSKSFPLNEHKKESFQINNILNNERKSIEEQNLNGSSNAANFTKNDDLNKSNAIEMSQIDEADSRRKSLIKQSSMLSDALSAMCSEIPEDTTHNKLKRFSIKENKIDDKYNGYNLKENIENDLLKTSIIQSNDIESSSFDESELQDSLGKKSSISNITNNKHSIDLENDEKKLTPKLNDEIIVSDISNEINDINIIKTPEISNTDTPLNIDINQKKLDDFENNDITSKKTDCDLVNGILDTNSHISNDLNTKSISNDVNTSQLLNKVLLNHQELYSTPNSLPKDNNMDIVLNESISSNEMKSKNAEKGLYSDASTNALLLSKEKKDNDNQEISLNEHFVSNEDERNSTKPITEKTNIKILEQPSEDTMNKENGKTLKLKTMDTTNEENGNKSTCGIKNIGGIQNIRCNNNVSVVFFFVRSKIVIIQVI